METVFGVTIKLNNSAEFIGISDSDADIGLYDCAPDPSEFRWVQNSLLGLSATTSMIVQGGLEPLVRSINLKNGGNIADESQCAVTIHNTASFMDTIKALGIYLNGCIAYLWCHYHSAGTLSSSEKLAVLVCGEPSWTVTDYTIPLRGVLNKRTAQIGTILTELNTPNLDSSMIGTMLPVVFGKIPKCKHIRTTKKNTVLDNQYYGTADPDQYGDPWADTFPVVAKSGTYPCKKYIILLGINVIPGTQKDFWPTLVNKYVRIATGGGIGTVGDGSNGEDFTGTMRKIKEATYGAWGGSNWPAVEIETYDYFEDDLSYNNTATATNQCYVQFIDLDFQYQCDTWRCGDWYNAALSSTLGSPIPYIYDAENRVSSVESSPDPAGNVSITGKLTQSDKDFFEEPREAIDASSDSNRNIVEITTHYMNAEDASLSGFTVLPLRNPILYNESDLYKWIANPGPWGYRTASNQPGLFVYSDHSEYESLVTIENVSGELSDTVDGDVNTFVKYHINGSSAGYYDGWVALALEFDIPDLPEELLFDNAYLGIYYKSFSYTDAGRDQKFYVGWRPFFGSPVSIISSSLETDFIDDDGSNNNTHKAQIINLSEIYLKNVATENKEFFVQNTAASPYSMYWGYKLFPLGGAFKDIRSLRRIYKFAVIPQWHTAEGNTGFDMYPEIYDIALIFERNGSVKDSIYIPRSGRLYASTWGNRRSESALIERPSDIIEYASRLQDYSETDSPPVGGWGVTYSDAALIQTGATYGSFDASAISSDDAYNLKVSREILDLDEAKTDAIKRSVARNFFYGSWINRFGQESIAKIIRDATTPTVTISLADIPSKYRSEIALREPDIDYIYPEPFVRYGKNYGSDEYEKEIRFSRVQETTYTEGYVTGYSGELSRSENYWEKCQALFKKSRQINAPPSELTDLKWMDSGTSDSDEAAKRYIEQWIEWMYNPSISLMLPLEKVLYWEECTRFNLTLPHQTAGGTIECIVTKIKKDFNPPYMCAVEAIIFSESASEDYNIQDVYSATVEEWQDQYSSGGDIQDEG